jgi:general secretion pathway protein E/type IV pilus assembly protein PilB
MTITTVHVFPDAESSVFPVERLIAAGLVTESQLRIAIRQKRRRDEPLGPILVKLGFISEGILRDMLHKWRGQDSIDLSTALPDPEALKMVPKNIARQFSVVPVCFDWDTNVLTLAMADPQDIVVIDQVAATLSNGTDIATLLAEEAEIESAIERFYQHELSIREILREIDDGDMSGFNATVENEEHKQPLTRLVNAILVDAVERRVSAVHLEPESGFVRVRYRIDGVLRQVMALDRGYWPGMVTRLKVMSGMNIANTGAQQDGKISLTLAGRRIDFTVACQATLHGENLVLRVQDRCKRILPLQRLGLQKETLSALQLMMARPEGIIFVASPAGNGKTTTLYSMLDYRNDESVNIVTLEDPVEYPTPMIRQSSLNESDRLDFENSFLSIMHQDPDVILIGEVHGEETAESVFRAAMTGHQVFTTLNASSVFGVVPRLIDMGVKPQTMAGNVIGIVAQRLVRRLCENCKRAFEPDQTERKLLGISRSSSVLLYRECACEVCNFLGYKGQIGLTEVLRINEELDDMIARVATRREMHKVALESGFKDLTEDAVRHVLSGKTSLSEISRVVDLTAQV